MFKLSKTLLNISEDAVCGLVYIPPEGSRYSSPDCFSEIEQEIINVESNCKYLCLFGDFNARVGKMQDYYTPDDFLAHVTHCEIQSEVATRSTIFDNYQIPLDRIVRDHTINNFGYKLDKFCKNNDIYILNSRVGDDKNIGGTPCKDISTVDYVFASANYFANLESFNIKHFFDLFSDVHNPTLSHLSFVLMTLKIVKTNQALNSGVRTKQTIFAIIFRCLMCVKLKMNLTFFSLVSIIFLKRTFPKQQKIYAL